jgi:hypothetical protein
VLHGIIRECYVIMHLGRWKRDSHAHGSATRVLCFMGVLSAPPCTRFCKIHSNVWMCNWRNGCFITFGQTKVPST